jgi:dTDP-4-amino-4,6-dideoxygalactose transaminase
MKNPSSASGPIFVTRPFLPPLDEYVALLEQMWASRQLTNEGPFHVQFEAALKAHLGVPHISLFSNGMLGLIVALQALRIEGEVITTPFSFVATTHALHWNGIKPVFCDIEPDTFNLDPDKIEAAITPRTTAIMPVHVYGNPCNVERIGQIAERHGLKVIYDAAHTFGARLNGRSLADFGDLAVLSFHATKVFNTFEGGAIVSRDAAMKERIDFLKNFGFADDVTVVGPGINAKMNEPQAAMGLLQLKYVAESIRKRQAVSGRYRERLRGVRGLRVLEDVAGVEHNFAYFPVLIDGSAFGRSRDEVHAEMGRHGIFTRRYFYPLISRFPIYRELESAASGNLPAAELVAGQVLCLPIYPDLAFDEIDRVVAVLTRRP